MNQFIDITKRDQLNALFLNLNPEVTPLWGIMKPQQMVEHLIDQVEYTNGKKIPTCDNPPEVAEQQKKVWIYTDIQIPKNAGAPGNPNLPVIYRYENMGTAIKQLMIELGDFDEYFKTPDLMVIHGGFGPMGHQEWIIWHGKHFTHHLKQFGLLP